MNSYQAIAKEVCRMLDFQPSTIIFTIINLLVLYFFFRKFLFGRVNAVLEQREQLIEKEIGEAEEKNQKAEAMQKEYEDKLAGAREEAAQLVASAKTRADQAYAARMAGRGHPGGHPPGRLQAARRQKRRAGDRDRSVHPGRLCAGRGGRDL